MIDKTITFNDAIVGHSPLFVFIFFAILCYIMVVVFQQIAIFLLKNHLLLSIISSMLVLLCNILSIVVCIFSYVVDTEFSLVFQYNFINPIIAIVISAYCLVISYLYAKALWIKNYKIWSKVVMIFTIVSTILLLPIII